MSIDPSIIVQALILVGVIYNAWLSRHQTPAQKDKDVIANYTALLDQYRLRMLEEEKEISRLEAELKEEGEAHLISDSNYEAIIKKRDIECNEDVRRAKKETEAYQIGYAKLRRIAVRYVPKEIVLPEINGNSTVDMKGD